MFGSFTFEILVCQNLSQFLKLDTCAFNGTLPPQLGDCQKLYFLDVNSNELGGKIPVEYGKLGNMKTLGLANNDFTGAIPAELSQMAALGKLNVYCFFLSRRCTNEAVS